MCVGTKFTAYQYTVWNTIPLIVIVLQIPLCNVIFINIFAPPYQLHYHRNICVAWNQARLLANRKEILLIVIRDNYRRLHHMTINFHLDTFQFCRQHYIISWEIHNATPSSQNKDYVRKISTVSSHSWELSGYTEHLVTMTCSDEILIIYFHHINNVINQYLCICTHAQNSRLQQWIEGILLCSEKLSAY